MRPGYPKLIRDIWGIEGPIDAAFTRINCQGKTYLFKVPDTGVVGQGQGYLGVEGYCTQDQDGQEGCIPTYGPWLWLCEDREAQSSRLTSLEQGLLSWVGDSAPVPSQSPPHFSPPSLTHRAVSTGALRMVSWTPIILATSLMASRAFQTTWTQPWPFQLTVTVAGSGSTSSRVLRDGGENEQAVEQAVIFHTPLGIGIRW